MDKILVILMWPWLRVVCIWGQGWPFGKRSWPWNLFNVPENGMSNKRNAFDSVIYSMKCSKKCFRSLTQKKKKKDSREPHNTSTLLSNSGKRNRTKTLRGRDSMSRTKQKRTTKSWHQCHPVISVSWETNKRDVERSNARWKGKRDVSMYANPKEV